MTHFPQVGHQVRLRSHGFEPRLRRAGPGDADGLTKLFQSEYVNSSHPFRTAGRVLAFLSDSRNFLIVAEDGYQIVSSMAMTYYPWNSTYELGRSLTLPDYRRGGLAAALMQRVVDWVSKAGLGELFFGYPRVRRMVDLCAALEPPMLVVGHDAGLNVANGSRETHLIVACAPAHGSFEHIAPLPGSVFGCSSIQGSTYDKLKLRGKPGQYPRRVFVGAIAGSVMQTGDFLVKYDPSGPNQAVGLLSSRPSLSNPAELCSRLRKCLACFPEARHAAATVLADKGAVIQGMEELGFRITAYLPAWYKAGRARFDCVQMARAGYTEPPGTQNLGDLIADFDRAVSHGGAAAVAGAAAVGAGAPGLPA